MTAPSSPDPALQPFWAAVYALFDPLRPVDVPSLRVARDSKYSPTDRVVPLLSSPFEDRRIVVAGGIGSGKSTELLVIAERLAPKRSSSSSCSPTPTRTYGASRTRY